MRFPAHGKRLGISVWRLVFISLLFTIIYLLFTSSNIFAQTNSYQGTVVGNSQSGISITSNFEDDVPLNQRTFVQSMVIETLVAVSCQLSGTDPTSPDRKCLGIDSTTGKIGFVENGGGVIGLVANSIKLTYTQPASSTQYINYLASNFGITDKAYAQKKSSCVGGGKSSRGIGFCGITPLIPMWVAMRNIVYLLFVIMFAIIGMAIMLRVKIDPRTVMSIQNQIPKIIIGIIMVTFSFAIAGFLIDIMYLSIYVVGQILIGIPNVTVDNFGAISTSGTTFDVINRLWPGDPDVAQANPGGFIELSATAGGIIDGFFRNIMGWEEGSGNFFDDIGKPGQFVPTLASSLIGIIAAVIIFIGLLFVAIRVLLALLLAYINILLDVIFAPFWFLIGLMPGSSLGVGAWFRDIVANLAVFPTAIAMFLLGKIFFDMANNVGIGGQLFTPPLVGGIGGGKDGAAVFAGLIAIGFLFLTPTVLQITKNTLKAPKSSFGNVFQPASIGFKGAGRIGQGAADELVRKNEKPGAKPGVISKNLGRALRTTGIGRPYR